MANPEHLKILKQGVTAWNRWREDPSCPELLDLNKAHMKGVDLSGVNFRDVVLVGANLRGANLSGAILNRANLSHADLRDVNLFAAFLRESVLVEANLRRANLERAYLSLAALIQADLREANLIWADFNGASLMQADFRGANLRQARFNGANLTLADLRGADLKGSTLIYADLTLANLSNSYVHGISAWNLKLSQTLQSNLIITPDGEPTITVDNLEVAQFMYLLLHNEKIRDIINTITSKVVLILGRFTPERKAVLDALRDALRKKDYLPVLFDFDKPASRDFTETISTIAHMARFVIADITDAKSIPQELQRIVPDLPSVPVQPLLLDTQFEYGMFEHFKKYPWVLNVYRYKNQKQLIAALDGYVIAPAEKKAAALQKP